MRLGLIGLKGHQSVVIKGARELGDVELVAVSEDDPSALDTFLRNDSLAKAAERYTDWRHLVEHTMMDVCCICDENGIRPEQIEALAARNVHIVTEKPLATSLQGLETIRKALGSSQSRLTMLLTMRHEAKYAVMRSLIQKGAIGTPALATAQKSYRIEERPQWQKERARLGGTIPYIGIHALDMMRWLTGLDYREVAAFHANIGTPEFGETEDQASLLLRLANGASATAHLDYLRPDSAPTHGDDRVRIAGTDGVIEAGSHLKKISLIRDSEPPVELEAPPVENLFVGFVKALRENRPSPISAEDCLYISEVVLLARESAETSKVVAIPPRARPV